jgi:hypothetical protein
MNKFLPRIPASNGRNDAGAVYANPFATFSRELDREIADLETRIARWRYQPTAAEAAQDAADEAADAAAEAADAAADAEADRIADGIESGDLDAAGEPIAYPFYRSI